MESRRGLALGVLVAALTGELVIYESSPATRAHHRNNWWLALLVGLLAFASLLWLVFDSHIQRLYADLRGDPYPVARCVVAGQSATLILERLARVDEWIECKVILPDRTHSAANTRKTSGSPNDNLTRSFPADFDIRFVVFPQPGKYRVIWTPWLRRQGSAEMLRPVASASFKMD
jgi:hypothetical protein